MISKYLKELIDSNNRIIIPDFGAFMIQDSPEGKQISFNDFLKFNDGLLVNQIIKTDKISKDQATSRIKEFVAAVEKSFTQKKPYHIEGIGYLNKDSHGNIKFEAKAGEVKPAQKKEEQKKEEPKKTEPIKKEPKKAEATKDVKADTKSATKTQQKLPTDIKPTIELAGEAKKEEKPESKTTTPEKPKITQPSTAKTIAQPTNETKKNIPNQTTSKPKPTYSSSSKPSASAQKSNSSTIVIIIIAAVIVLGGGIWALFNFGIIGGKKAPAEITEVTPPVIDTVIPQDTVIEDTIIEEPKVIEEPATPEPKFYLIGGSFKVVANAERFNQKLINEGFNSEIIVRNNGFHCVSYKSFITWDEVVIDWREMKNSNQQVWILKK